MHKIAFYVLTLLLIFVLVPGVLAQDDEEEPFALTILHTNDEHSAHEPNGDGDGGAARQATVVDQIRAEVDNSLLVDGGDRFTGTLFHQLYRGSSNAQIMNMLGYDTMTLGNHEFDDGDEVLASFVTALDFPVVTANVDFSDSPILAGLIDPWVIIEVGGENIGVIGLVTAETEILSSPGPELVFEHDLTAVTQAAVDEISAEGVNKIILLTHIGFDADVTLAESVSGVDVIVGGHTNTFMSNIYSDASQEYPVVIESTASEPVLVVQASTKTEYLGRLDMEFDADGVLSDWEGDAILLSRYITPDPDVSDLIAGLAEPIAELRDTPVGEASVALVGDRSLCRFEECNMGNLIADAIRAETGVDIAFQNGGGIRADIDEGPVSLGEVLTVLPFGNLISTFEFSGADVIAAVEHGVNVAESQDNEGTGRFLQVSGLRYTFDVTQEPGSRVVSVEVETEGGEFAPIDPDAIYRVAINDFNRNGGDGFEMFANNAINPYDQGSPLDQAVAEYIEANSPVAPEVEGRITRIE